MPIYKLLEIENYKIQCEKKKKTKTKQSQKNKKKNKKTKAYLQKPIGNRSNMNPNTRIKGFYEKGNHFFAQGFVASKWNQEAISIKKIRKMLEKDIFQIWYLKKKKKKRKGIIKERTEINDIKWKGNVFEGL